MSVLMKVYSEADMLVLDGNIDAWDARVGRILEYSRSIPGCIFDRLLDTQAYGI